MTILGISLSSRILALAVLRDGELMDYRIQQFQDRWSALKEVRITASMQRFIRDYAITSIALSLPHEQNTSKESKTCLAKVLAGCKKNAAPVTAYEHKTLHNICEGSKARQKALMCVIAHQFPELKHFLRRELKNRRPYYCKLFEAVAVAKQHQLSLQ